MKNIKLYYLYQVWAFPGFWVPVLFLFFSAIKGFPTIETFTLLGFYSLFAVILEVPTGALADKLSRKTALFLGNLVFGLSLILWILIPENNFILFLLVAIPQAFGGSLISGPDRAMVYETLKQNEKSSEYKSVMGKANIINLVTTALYTFLGGVLGSINLNYPIIISAVFYILGGITCLFMDEPKIHEDLNGKSNLLDKIIRGFKYFFSREALSNKIFYVGIIGSLFLGFFAAVKYFYTPTFDFFKIDIAAIGAITSIYMLARALGSAVLIKFAKSDSGKVVKLSFMFTSLMMILAGIVFNAWAVISIFFLLNLTSALIGVAIDDIVNKDIKPDIRTTVLSVNNLLNRVSLALLNFVFGILSDKVSIQYSILMIGALLLVASIIFVFAYNSRNKVSSI